MSRNVSAQSPDAAKTAITPGMLNQNRLIAIPRAQHTGRIGSFSAIAVAILVLALMPPALRMEFHVGRYDSIP
jgi:hypothetical protein